jgi:hypothetical protein
MGGIRGAKGLEIIMKFQERSFLVKEGYLRRGDQKRFYPFVFEVPEGIGEIRVKFSYSPRILKNKEKNYQMIGGAIEEYVKDYPQKEKISTFLTLIKDAYPLIKNAYPLRNLLNLSLYDAKGSFVGRWDQNSERPVRISSTYSSPGFTSCKIIPGFWKVEMETHAIVTEECKYRLEISSIQQTNGENFSSFKKKLINSSSYRDNKGWYRGELHVHSHHSDGKNTLPEIIEGTKREGLDFIALTDHNTVSGFSSIPMREDLLIIRGMELTTYYGHALALGITSFIDWHSKERMRNINDIIDEVHLQKGLFAIAHPFCIGDPVCSGCTWKLENIDYQKVDLIEVWVGCWKNRKIENYKSFRLWDKLLNQGLKVVGISGRDWHDVNERKSDGIPKTFVYADSLSEDEILKGLRKGQVFVSSGPQLFFSAEYEDKRYKCGDEIKLTEKKIVSFQIRVENLKELCQLQVIKNGLRFFSRFIIEGKSQRIEFSDLPEEESWYRCEIYTEEDKELLCFTNPISITPLLRKQ